MHHSRFFLVFALVGGVLLASGFALAWQPSAALSVWLPASSPDSGAAISSTLYLPVTVKDFDGSVTITVWHQWPADQLPTYESLISQFEAANPKIHVALEEHFDMFTALSNAIPAGTGPDLIASDSYDLGHFAQRGYLIALDSWINLAYLNSVYEPAAVRLARYQQQTWAIPGTLQGIALVYNKALLTAASLPAPDDFAALRNLAQVYQTAHPDDYYLCNQGLGGSDTYHAAPVFFGFGLDALGGYVDQYGSVNMTTTQAISAAQWIGDFQPYAPMTTSYSICQDLFTAGSAAIWWTGPWAIEDLQSAGVQFGIAPMGSPYVSGLQYSVTSNAVGRGSDGAARTLALYLSSSEAQIALAQAHGLVPSNSAALASPAVQALENVVGFAAAIDTGVALNNTPYVGCQWGPLGTAFNAIWNGWQTPEQALLAAQNDIEACIAALP